MKHLFAFLWIAACSITLQAQSVDEIIADYYNAIGGANWDKVNSITMKANVEQGGMKIPVEVVRMRDGRTYTQITVMGNTMTMQAFDGTTSWTTNFMSMEAEKSTSDETENAKRSAGDFPEALLQYKKLGYTPTLMGNETVDGTSCYKIKLEKKTQLVEGKETANVEYLFIDQENKVPLMMEAEIMEGEMKGKIGQTKFSDYQEVEGVYLPFSNVSGIKGEGTQTIQFESIVINAKIDETKFNFPKK